MKNNICFPSYAISASAGCGKTEEMALRLLGMFLASPDDPQQIFKNTMASTFSRSGAKEIYNRILELLFNSLLKNDMESLNTRLQSLNINIGKFERSTYIKLLRSLIFAVNDLKICTIDSFMNSIVNSFFQELGLPGKPSLVNSAEENILTEQALKKLLLKHSHDPGEREKEYRDLANECKKALYAKDSRNYFNHIKELIEKYNIILDNHPDVKAYRFMGNVDEIFSAGQNQTAWETLSSNPTESRTKSTKNKAALYDVLKKIAFAGKNTNFSTAELTRMRDFYDKWEDLKQHQTSTIESFSKEKFSEKEINAIIYLLYCGAYILLQQTIIRSEAMLNLTRQYKKCCNEVFYGQSKITFADLPRLLGNSENDWTFDIAYRLNCRMCNYLIDEFQDTSRIQWHVLNSIFDRPDDDSPFSLFIVGDVKQAIYGWRAGDRKLMGEVIDLMNQQIGLEQKPLNCSFRYGENICRAINHIFDGKAIMNDHFFPGTGRLWNDIFQKHTASEKLHYRSKFSAFLLNKTKNQDVPEIFASLLLKKIKEAGFIENKSSCAILVRTSKEGFKLLDALRRDPQYGSIFIWEGKQKIGNDKLINALLNMLIYIQHPADTMAKELAQMLPAIRFLIPFSSEKAAEENNRLIQEGFYTYLKKCIAKIQTKSNIKFSCSERESIELFLQSAYEFDHSSIVHDSRIFKEYIRKIEHSNETVGFKIPVMTVHHSKGLTYEHVFTAIIDDISIVNRDSNKIICGKTANQHWILNSVNKEFTVFEDIKFAWDQSTREQIFEEICNMYVALSRAKYTMTLLLPPLSDKKTENMTKGKSLHEAGSYFISDYMTLRLFNDRFAAEPVALDNDTFQYMEIDECNLHLPIAKNKKIEIKTTEPVNFKTEKSPSLHRRRIRPSDGIEEDSENYDNFKLYFNLPDKQKGKSFGSALHDILCKMDNFDLNSIPENISGAMRNEIIKINSNPEIRSLLANCDECWKERSFDVVLQQNYISGCFDRVQLVRDENKNIKSAVIIDYKSGRHSADDIDKIKRYHRQLNTYRSALSQLLQISISKISCFIIWTSDAELEKVEP